MMADDVDALARTRPSREVRLLAGFDQYVLGPGTGDVRIVPADRRKAVSRTAGWISPVVVHEGRVVGVWELTDATVDVRLFPEADVPMDGLEAEVEHLRGLHRPGPVAGGGCGASPGQWSRASASARWARYQSTVRRRPWAKSVRASNPKAAAARLGSTRRRGWPSGLEASQRISPSKPVASATSLTRSRMGNSSSVPRLTGSAPVVALGGQHDALGGVVHEQELPRRRARAPHLDVVGARLLGVDALLDQRRDDVAHGRVELVARARRGWWA